MKMKYTCINCDKEYYSNKENSKFCSKKCQKEYGHIPYKCDYCGKDILVTRSSYEKLLNGERKHLYCSRQCANNGNKNSVNKICKNCGKEFTVWKSYENQSFCSKECYYEYNAKNKIKTCPVCKMEFVAKRKNQKYCSRNCRNISFQHGENCICDYCGKEFYRIKSEVYKNKHHYCSMDCKIKAMQMNWPEQDVNILKDNYKKISYKKMMPLFSIPKTMDEIRRKVGAIGLTSPRDWTDEETNILIENYENLPMNQLMKLIPNRTYSSILGKAKALNLKSYFYLNTNYTDAENKYLKENYLLKTNKELAENLNRTEIGIAQHLRVLNLYRPKEFDNYKNLKSYVRSRLLPWKNKVRENFNYTCALSGSRSNIIVHHIRSFNILFEETMEILDFQYKEMSEYSEEELDNFVNAFLDLQ